MFADDLILITIVSIRNARNFYFGLAFTKISLARNLILEN